jgi:hypothetical protein
MASNLEISLVHKSTILKVTNEIRNKFKRNDDNRMNNLQKVI